ncbi:MAG: hypothetical protein QNJ75_01045 [Acidimicrobiia bacterium]|nr:hypothetical protein [Acidimicrobiia bacterium]
MSDEVVARIEWPAVVASFRAFFEPLGEVVTSEEEVEFSAKGTGLALRQDGTSKSFMPLHDLEAAWDTIVFDREADEVKLVGPNATYTYRVPPYLRR